MKLPHWLPDMLDLTNWDNNTFNLLYNIFSNDFINKTVRHKNNIILIDRNIIDGKEATFWHITTREDKKNNDRFPDHRRCERLPWLKHILENNHSDILSWEYKEADGIIKTYVWLKDHDYVAILKNTKHGLILITAYWVEYGNTKRKLMQKYNSRYKKAND